MKKFILAALSLALLWTGCTNELNPVQGENGEMVKVTVSTVLEQAGQSTRAVWDNDGNGACVNHWIMEVYDAQGQLFDRQEKKNQSGLTNSFDITLIKNQSYQFAFWADTKDMYDTKDLREVKTVSRMAGRDKRDAFFAEVDYTSTKSETLTAKLYRPFAQVNVVTLDLAKLYSQMEKAGTTADYDKFIPQTIKLKTSTYNKFNVLTGAVDSVRTYTLNISECYADYSAHAAKTTIFMDYGFAADEKEVKDMKFSFVSNGEEISYDFTNIPVQRNYRTNISGNLLSNDATWNVEIIPAWKMPDFNVQILPEGALPGVFSIGEDKSVRFSKGNLRAQKVEDTWTWGFYDKQYQCNLGKGISNRTANGSDEGIDLFTWGYGNWSEDPVTTVCESGSFTDWGTAVAGDAIWRTLTLDEWKYLINKENAATVRQGKYKCGVNVCGLANCMILAPDDFTGTIAASYDETTWEAAETEGLVCLPPAGNRYETDVYFISVYGYYWTASPDGAGDAYLISFDENEPFPGMTFENFYGHSVRLVTNAE